MTQGELLSHNLFAYGLNDPINNIDESGYLSTRNKWIIGGVIVAVVVVAVVVVATGGMASPLILAAKGGISALKLKTTAMIAKGGASVKLSQKAVNYATSNMSRLQHAFKHGNSLGFGNWNKATSVQWKFFIENILQNYTKTFQNTIGSGHSVTGYYKYMNEMHVVVYIYNSGPYKGLVATVVKLKATQMKKFGL